MPANLYTSRSKAAQWEGLPELQQRIAKVIDRASGQEVRRTLIAAAELLKDEARKLAPISKEPHKFGGVTFEPGSLRNAVHVRYGRKDKPEAFVWVSKRLAPYQHLVEYGTSKMAAEPFWRPARKNTSAAMISLIANGMRKIIAEGEG